MIEADWPVPSKVRALTTTRAMPGYSQPPYQQCNLGARSGDDPSFVRRNRALLAAGLGLPAEPLWLHQVHGSRVLNVTAPVRPTPALEEEPTADAAVTRRPETVLAVLSADCLPVLFASDDGTVVGAAHAGWRGLAAGVLEQTIAALGVEPSRILAWLGPAIGVSRYEVDAVVRDAFIHADPGACTCFRAGRSGHWQGDLYGLARRRLQVVGVDRIYGGDRCTFVEAGLFYSYRRDGPSSGRQASLIWIVGDGAASML